MTSPTHSGEMQMSVLHDILEYLEEYEDVIDGNMGEQRPNRAMSLANDLRALLSKPEQPKGCVVVRHEFASTARDGAQETCSECGEHFTHVSHDESSNEREAHFERLYMICEGEKERLREDLRKALTTSPAPRDERDAVLEEAAKVCEDMPCECCWHEDAQIMAETCAKAIRALKSDTAMQSSRKGEER